MLFKLSSILLYTLTAFFLALALYPSYIALLRKLKIGKQIRDDAVTGEKASIFHGLHRHKAWTPTMWGWLVLLIVVLMVGLSYLIQYRGITNNALVTRQETYIILFALLSMWLLGLIDDWMNILGKQWIKGMTARFKILWMCLFAGFISYWFYVKLWVTALNFRPLWWEIDLSWAMPVFTFLFTISLANAINITDGLDGLAAWLLLIVLGVLWIMTFVAQWYLATTVVGVVLWCLIAFLRFNINPAKIFMGDSGALAFGWLIATLVYLLNIKFGVFIPFLILMGIFWVELLSSFLQIFWKKIFKRKLFSVAPIHHLLEHRGYPEATIVMKLWVVQGVLAVIALIALLYQF